LVDKPKIMIEELKNGKNIFLVGGKEIDISKFVYENLAFIDMMPTQDLKNKMLNGAKTRIEEMRSQMQLAENASA
jgi:hypothetical protein